MKKKQVLFLLLGVVMISLSLWQLYSAQRGLSIISIHSGNPPVTIIKPDTVIPPNRPTILIAHGLAGSRELMRGFSFTQAHAGYTTVSWDFSGHGKNPNPLNLSDSASLLADADAALKVAASTGFVDTQRVAILGHSMGSGVALDYGLAHPGTFATIAVSPVKRAVSPSLPRNLLLMAGSLEQQFVRNAENLLNQAGGNNAQIATGSARELVIIPNVEHISILFSPQAHREARSWLDSTFGNQAGAQEYTDRRVLWFAFGIFGILLTGWSLLTVFNLPASAAFTPIPSYRKLFALIGGCLAAVLILWLLSNGIQVSRLFGILVGGYLLVWFDLAGIIGLSILKIRLSKPVIMELVIGLAAFAILWVGVGLVGNYVWLPWLLIPKRLFSWVFGAILLFPWFYLIANLIRNFKLPARFLWWLIQSLAIIGSLLLALRLNPELGFLVLILPLVPVMIAFHMLLISPQKGVWAYGMSGAMFTAWIILAVFPLV